MFNVNQVNKPDPKSTSLARLKKRRDELMARGVSTASLSRLIHEMEKPLLTKISGPVPSRWFCTEQEIKDWGYGKVRQPKTEDQNKKRKGGKR